MLRSGRVWIGLAVTLVFLFLLLRQTDLPQLAEVLRRANYFWLLPGIPAYFLGVWYRSHRWRRLLAPARALTTRELFRYVVMGYMANDVLPARIGELVRAYLTSQRFGVSKAVLLGTIALERITDGLVLLAMLGVVALTVPLEGWLRQTALILALAFVGVFLMLGLIVARRASIIDIWRTVAPRLPGQLVGPAASLAGRFVEGLDTLRQPQQLAVVFFYGLLAWLCEAGVFLSVALALGLELPLSAYFLSMSVANLATALPSSQAGIGPFEYFCAQGLVLFGASDEASVAYAVLVHGILIIPVVLLGLVYLWQEQLSLKQLTDRALQMSPSPAAPAPDAGQPT